MDITRAIREGCRDVAWNSRNSTSLPEQSIDIYFTRIYKVLPAHKWKETIQIHKQLLYSLFIISIVIIYQVIKNYFN